MANSVVTKVEVDGPCLTVLSITGILDTSDQASLTIADVATLEYMDFSKQKRAKGLGVSRVEYAVQDGLTVELYFDATPTPELMYALNGRGKFESERIGWKGIQSPGKTGKITLKTLGFVSGGTFTFSISLYLRKQSQ